MISEGEYERDLEPVSDFEAPMPDAPGWWE